jgi:hypothetical protein
VTYYRRSYCSKKKYLCMPSVWRSWGYLDSVLTSALSVGGWATSRTGLFTPGERVPVTQVHSRLGGPRSPSGRFGKREHLLPLPEIEPWFVGCAVRLLKGFFNCWDMVVCKNKKWRSIPVTRHGDSKGGGGWNVGLPSILWQSAQLGRFMSA